MWHTGSVVVACGLSCMWDLPGSGLEPVSPALAGGFLTTAPPGKAPGCAFLMGRPQKRCVSSVHHSRWHTLHVCPHVGEISLDPLVQEVSARPSHCPVTLHSLYLICNLWADTWRLYKYPDPNHTFTHWFWHPWMIFLTTSLHRPFHTY